MLKIVICDDEVIFTETMKEALAREFGLHGLQCEYSCYTDGKNLLQKVGQTEPEDFPDLIFLDISMPGTTGMDVAKKLREKKQNQKIVFVEGDISHNGVDVDLFENAASIERIICPSSQAWERYTEILDACRQLPKDRLMLVSLGAAGKVLTVDLHRLGYRVIDVGSLDMEYGWFCEGAAEKCRVIKHEIHTREENEAAGYFDYLDQILTTIH